MLTYNFMEIYNRSTDKEFMETDLGGLYLMFFGTDTSFIRPDGPWLAGGSIRRTLVGEPVTSDYDFFFKNEQQLNRFKSDIIALGAKLVKETEHHIHYKFESGYDIQLIKFQYYNNIEELLDSFDYTICQFAWDGKNLYCSEYALWDLARKRLVVNKITFPVSSMRRLLKYVQQGFYACSGCLATILNESKDKPEEMMQIAYID